MNIMRSWILKSFFKINKIYIKREEYLVGYAFLLPDTIGLIIFWIIPILYAIYLSFFEWRLNGSNIFIGLQNYIDMFKDSLWWKSLVLTGVYSLFFVLGVTVISLFLAVLLTKKIKFRNLFRTMFFLPYAVSMVTTGLVWTYMLDYKIGVINYPLKLLGLPSIDWLGYESLALISIIFISIWKYMGFFMIIFISGLEEIPKEYYEAASIDGAGAWKQFKHITLPVLKPVFFLIFILAFIRSFQVFDLIYVMTAGGPNYGTYISTFHIFKEGFTHLKFGYASALSVVLFIITLSITLWQKNSFEK